MTALMAATTSEAPSVTPKACNATLLVIASKKVLGPEETAFTTTAARGIRTKMLR